MRQEIAKVGLIYRGMFRKFLVEIGVDFIEVKNWGQSIFYGNPTDEQWEDIKNLNNSLTSP